MISEVAYRVISDQLGLASKFYSVPWAVASEDQITQFVGPRRKKHLAWYRVTVGCQLAHWLFILISFLKWAVWSEEINIHEFIEISKNLLCVSATALAALDLLMRPHTYLAFFNGVLELHSILRENIGEGLQRRGQKVANKGITNSVKFLTYVVPLLSVGIFFGVLFSPHKKIFISSLLPIWLQKWWILLPLAGFEAYVQIIRHYCFNVLIVCIMADNSSTKRALQFLNEELDDPQTNFDEERAFNLYNCMRLVNLRNNAANSRFTLPSVLVNGVFLIVFSLFVAIRSLGEVSWDSYVPVLLLIGTTVTIEYAIHKNAGQVSQISKEFLEKMSSKVRRRKTKEGKWARVNNSYGMVLPKVKLGHLRSNVMGLYLIEDDSLFSYFNFCVDQTVSLLFI